MPDITIGATFPGELLAVEALRLMQKLVEGMTPEQKAQCWQWYIEDMKAWRKLWGLGA